MQPHAFRHAFGTAAIEVGVRVDAMQGYLGHASTTAIHNKAGACRWQSEVATMSSEEMGRCARARP
ncbi:hypothetical protein [Ralstonia solanacearum]|uniref:hypothetical protein n=1 Tax=Ralstonia solanacearum TaxID=305 RepID=UPI00399D594A